MTEINRTLCVAPMMEWTDRHCRYFLRLISPDAFLFTEMVTAKAVIYGDKQKLIGFNPEEHPVAVQLGGSTPHELAEAARICEDFGYDEINLNVGCPSDRVKSGMFGACLMAQPQLVADCIAAMQNEVRVPVTVKCRIGIDDQDSEKDLNRFIALVAQAGCKVFYVHARKAWLQGLSPKENRTVPPLDYERVYRLKQARPDLEIIINGGIENAEVTKAQLGKVDGVMLGRAAYHNPWLLAQLQQDLFPGNHPKQSREDILEQLIPYAKKHLEGSRNSNANSRAEPNVQKNSDQNINQNSFAPGESISGESNTTKQKNYNTKEKLHSITRHIMGLYLGQSGARAYRRFLSEVASRPNTSIEVLEQALIDIRSGTLKNPF